MSFGRQVYAYRLIALLFLRLTITIIQLLLSRRGHSLAHSISISLLCFSIQGSILLLRIKTGLMIAK